MRLPLYLTIALLLGMLFWSIFIWDPETMGPTADGPSHEALELADEPEGGDFRLESKDGPAGLEDLRGQVVILYFGYTYCPDVCPMSLAAVGGALDRLSEQERDQVTGLFVSIDPRRDTPERVAEYAEYFHEGIVGLTGSPGEIEAVAERYGAVYEVVGDSGGDDYLVDHSSFFYLIDPDGELVETLPHGSTPPELVEAVRSILPEQ